MNKKQNNRKEEYLWDILDNKILEIIKKKAVNKKIIDLMCGDGYLLSEIRKDKLFLEGIDISRRCINQAKQNYPKINFICEDVFEWKPNKKYNIIICKNGLHNFPENKRKELLKKIHKYILSDNGFCIFGDPYIDDYSNEEKRRLSILKLYYETMCSTIKADMEGEINDTIHNLFKDLMCHNEYKTSIEKIIPEFNEFFKIKEYKCVWPKDDRKTGYGHYYFICEKK